MSRRCEHEFRAATWTITEHNPAGSLVFACPHDGCDGEKYIDLTVDRRFTYFPRMPMLRYIPLEDSGFGGLDESDEAGR
ncbi:hypothetical protein PN419_00075 [Halorubrum ezzemoulense]|uniref:hypothetical protein n=1 Tax=Halorubrum ezzemoulense TaxID=337243 RepID=UPI00232CB84B|nr:hypothetical protein [Halorubrum ezzemoulense]MDB9247403.1 hypothetical protein [Halorubrum ezzemoulense]MDB9258688.1 hypothetical protein [Halorubrum ezzemoulense]MDB9264454.1 hypothetical protein [Halorubrum ezzemoulense]MDB9269049.1 hypothetical protein [Halorubrum ezzemoulense]MDB9271422.1 hypothetical protein [Halorubrum ezzemoulense]